MEMEILNVAQVLHGQVAKTGQWSKLRESEREFWLRMARHAVRLTTRPRLRPPQSVQPYFPRAVSRVTA
jgi:hypothetical protein